MMSLPTVSGKTVKFVKVIPSSQIKQEFPVYHHEEDEEEDEEIPCRICKKTFASDIALQNHAKLQHIDAFFSGDESVWRVMPKKPPKPTVPKVKKDIKKAEQERKLIEMKTNEMISSMAPANLTSLVSNEVSYIIVKSEGKVEEKIESKPPEVKKKKITEKVKAPKKVPEPKEQKPISGPFECLQQSEGSADGLCHQIFFSCCLYSEHFRDEHTKRRKWFRCQVCEKPLEPQLSNEQYPYTCQVCGEGFATNAMLSAHTAQSHEELKPFQCVVCRKRFTQQGGVKQHMRMHTGDRPYACTFCPKSFTQKSGLDQHLRIHTKVKPFRCVICDKSFCQSVHLKQHMRIHTNVAPFQCGICQKRFKQSSHLNYHLKNHNVNNMSEEQKLKYEQLMGLVDTGIVEVEIEGCQVDQSMECQEAVESITISEPDGQHWDVELCEVNCEVEEK